MVRLFRVKRMLRIGTFAIIGANLLAFCAVIAVSAGLLPAPVAIAAMGLMVVVFASAVIAVERARRASGG